MILFTSETENNKKQYFKSGIIYLAITAFTALFGAVYELFSHEVYSYYMIYAFAFPFVLGAIPYFIFYASSRIKLPTSTSEYLYNSGVGILTIGSILKGVLIIYGTTNNLIFIYWIVGVLLLIAAALFYTFHYSKN